MNLLKCLNIAEDIKDAEGTVHELTKEMVLNAISKMAIETTKLCAACPETTSLRTANPELAPAFSEHGWQVVCHDERVSVGHHGRFSQGSMLNRKALQNSALDKVCMEDLLNLIASFCCFWRDGN